MLSARVKKLEEVAKASSRTQYKTYRDDAANLHIVFSDGEDIQLPVIPFRPYQLEVQKALFVDGIKRFALSRPRRSGKEVESWNLLLQAAIELPGLYIMVYPTNVRARKILWEGAAFVNGRSIPFLEMIPKRLLAGKPNNMDMTIKLKNGAVIWIVGSDIDPDKLRGTNPLGIVYAEHAFQDPKVDHTMRPVLRQNGGWMICQSTFDGQNHFYQMIQRVKNDPLWYVRVDSIENLVDENGNRYITDEMIEEDRRAGVPEYLIQQEYYGVVQTNRETKYFSYEITHLFDNNKIVPELFISNKPAYTFWDLGMNDKTAICIVQFDNVDGKLRPIVIGYHEENNRNLSYYVNWCKEFVNRYGLYIDSHYLPHDGQKRDFNTGKNTIDFMRDLNQRAYIVPRPTSKPNAIEAMRQMLYITKFNEENTKRLIDCIAQYGKEYIEKLDTYRDRPIHDWSSHGVDSFQTMTLALNANLINETPMEIVYYHQ